MELSYDWRGFQGIFYPRRSTHTQASEPMSPIYCIVDEEHVLATFAEREDLSDWIGANYRDFSSHMKHRELIAFERTDAEKWMGELLTLTNYYEQVELLRARAVPKEGKVKSAKAKKDAPIQAVQPYFPRHFLFDGIQGWWSKVLPSSYGIFLRLEGKVDRDFLVIVRRGSLAGFQEPDLSALGSDKFKQPGEVIRFLADRHAVPIQGVFLSAADWAEWSKEPSPWREVARAVRSNRARLVPFRWGVATLVATRAFLGL